MSNASIDSKLNQGKLDQGEPKPLHDALRALPSLAPERSVWPELAAQLSRGSGFAIRKSAISAEQPTATRRTGRWFVPIALAAALVLAVGASRLLHRTDADRTAPAATVVPATASYVANATNGEKGTNAQSMDGQLAALQQRSQALEHWLRETARAATPLPGQDLAAAAEIEDMIGLVDVELNAAPRDAELPLWSRRVALLEDLTALRYSSYSLAETGVAARLTPATWNN
jgi:hypothetical protein